jgi:uncharacterized Zn finger protein
MEILLLTIIAIFQFINTGLLRRKSFSSTTKVEISPYVDKGKDCTTVHAPPLGASLCSHIWKQVQPPVVLKAIHEEKVVIVLQCEKCGSLDKTIETTSVVPKSMPALPPAPVVPCNHEWEEITNDVLEAPHEKKLNVILKCKKCGTLDKTESVTSKVPREFMPSLPRSECRHSWKVEKQVTLPSAYEQIVDMAKLATQSRSKSRPDAPEIDHEKLEPWMFRKTYLCERVCQECGEVNTTVASNIDGEQPALPASRLKALA